MKISTENKEVSSVEKLLTMKLWGGRDIRKDIFVKGPFCFRILKEKKKRNKKHCKYACPSKQCNICFRKSEKCHAGNLE